MIFYRCEWDDKYHINDYKDNNSINKAKDKINNEDIGKDCENLEVIGVNRGVCIATPGID